MAEIDIIDALNDCIDRMNAGESIEGCVRDYPQYSDRLRGLLGTGALVHHAQQYPDTEVNADQEQMRERIVRKQPAKPPRRINWLYPLAAVASIAVVFVLALALLGPAVGNVFSNLVKNYDPNYALNHALQLTADSSIVTANPTIVAMIQATEASITSGVQPNITLATPTAGPTGTPMLSMTPLPGIVATSVALMSPVPFEGTPTQVSAIELTPAPTGTTLAITLDMPYMTATPSPDSLSGLPTAILGATMIPVSPTPLPAILPSPVQVIPLNAGEIDDNARWDTYMQYRSNYLQQYSGTVHDVDVTGRQIITVTDDQGLPMLGARVIVMVGQTVVSESRTYANGQTLFFPNARPESRGAQSYRVLVEKGGAAAAFDLDPSHGSTWTMALNQVSVSSAPVKLDVMFLLDSTGSMSDEIAQLQNNILSISSQIAALSGNNVNVRYGLVTYRDRGDAYVTRAYDFTPDVGTFQATLSGVQADGGGDTPESLNEALHNAVQMVSWRGDDAVKLIFLVADAPPHLDYPNDYDYAQEMVIAAQDGIKIHPIASSGLTPDGEYIFRQLAEYTMGHFLFLTYQQGTSGAPGDVRPDLQVGTPAEPANQQQGDYTVEHLDELVLRLITDELAALQTRVSTGSGIIPPLLPLSGLPSTTQMLFPTATPTNTATPTALPIVPSLPPTQTSEIVPGSQQITVSLTTLLSLLMVGAFLGYAFHSRRAVPLRKRKNDEIIEPED